MYIWKRLTSWARIWCSFLRVTKHFLFNRHFVFSQELVKIEQIVDIIGYIMTEYKVKLVAKLRKRLLMFTMPFKLEWEWSIKWKPKKCWNMSSNILTKQRQLLWRQKVRCLKQWNVLTRGFCSRGYWMLLNGRQAILRKCFHMIWVTYQHPFPIHLDFQDWQTNRSSHNTSEIALHNNLLDCQTMFASSLTVALFFTGYHGLRAAHSTSS